MENQLENEIPEEIIEEIIPNDVPLENEMPKETIAEDVTVKEDNDNFHTVVNCNMLNVRQRPSKASSIVSIIEEGDKVLVDISPDKNINVDWSYVQLENGIAGYVMSKYIKEV